MKRHFVQNLNVLAVTVLLSCGCTSLRIQTPSGYEIKRSTFLINRSEALTLHDPDTGNLLGEYKRVDEGDHETLAVMAETIDKLAEKCMALQAASTMLGAP